jgi:hypothetical protein
MTARAPAPSLRHLLRGEYFALRRAAILRHALRGAAWIALWIALAVTLGAIGGITTTGAWLRLIALIGLSLVTLFVAARRAIALIPSFDGFLEAVETRVPGLRSLVRNAVDLETTDSAHTSNELATALRDQAAREIGSARVAALRPAIAARRPALALLALAAALAALTLARPYAIERSWNTLMDPAAAAPPVTLAVEPGSVRISPGATLSIRARVAGTKNAPQLKRSGQSAPVAQSEGSIGDQSVWRFDLPPITRDENYDVRIARVISPLYSISLSGDPQPVSFEIEYRAPAYARLPVQHGSSTRGDLSGLRGTRAQVEITFDRDLTSLDIALGQANVHFDAISPRRWRGVVPIDHDGSYAVIASSSAGRTQLSYSIHTLIDAPPVIAVRVPEGDQDLPAGQDIPFDVMGQDDLGLSTLDLEFHKDSGDAWQHTTVARFAGEPREAHVVSHWDASTLGLLPGETATFRFALYDNDAFGRGVAYSPSYTVRFPSLAELYQHVGDQQQATQGSLEKVAEQSRELQKKLDQLSRQAAATPNANSFERREEMKSALDRQQDLSQKLDQASQDLKQSLEQAAERKAFNDELTRRLKEMAELTSQIQSPEFKDALQRIQKALENMDRRALEQSLPDWKKQNEQMLANLERSIELLKRLREEENLDALAHRAEELKRQQDELNREHEMPAKSDPAKDANSAKNDAQKSDAQKNDAAKNDSAKDGDQKSDDTAKNDAKNGEEKKADALSEKQQQAAEQTQKLSQDVRETEKQAAEEQEKSDLDEAAKELEQNATQEQRESAEAAKSGQSSQAQKHGQSASQSLSKAHQQLAKMSQQMQQERQGLDVAAVRRGAQDLLSIQRASEEAASGEAPLDGRADRQTDLSDGTARVADSLSSLSQRNPFITPKLGEALGNAIQNLAASGREFGSGNRAQGEQSGRSGSEALNDAVLELRKAESSMCNSPQPQSGGGNKSGQQMSELGEKQSQLNQQSKSVTRRLSQQLRMSAGDQAEMRRLADEQRRIREQLEQMQKDEEASHKLLGRLDAARNDMKDVEEQLQQGTTSDELEQKQQHILSRLLDAARSVNRRDYDPDRESRPGEDLARQSPGAIPADLMRESDRLRLDLLKAETDRYPAQYRAFIESYLRSLNEARR